MDVLGIAISAVISGADGWAQVAKFGHCKLKWLKTFSELPSDEQGTAAGAESGKPRRHRVCIRV